MKKIIKFILFISIVIFISGCTAQEKTSLAKTNAKKMVEYLKQSYNIEEVEKVRPSFRHATTLNIGDEYYEG